VGQLDTVLASLIAAVRAGELDGLLQAAMGRSPVKGKKSGWGRRLRKPESGVSGV